MVTDAKSHDNHGWKSCAINTLAVSNIALDIHSQLSYTSINQAAERFPQKYSTINSEGTESTHA